MESSASRERKLELAHRTLAAVNAITEVADLLTSDSCRLAHGGPEVHGSL